MAQQSPEPTSTPDQPAPNPDRRGALLHVVITVALAAVVLAVGMTFSGGVQTSLLITSLVIAFVGAMIAAFRTFRSWQARGRWQFWQGAMWFLMFFTLVLMMGVIPVLTDGLGVI